MKNFKIGIIGAGLMGNRRALAIKSVGGAKLVAAADVNRGALYHYCQLHKCSPIENWKELLKRDDIDAVIVSTPNHLLKTITVEALKRKKHILV